MTRPSDTGRTAYPALALFLLTCAFMVIRTGRDALYFQADGLFGLPKAYIAIAILSIPQAIIMLKLLRTLGGRVTRLLTLAVVAVIVSAFHVVAEPGGGLVMTGFFVAIPLVFSVLFSLVWLLGGELYEDADKQRVARAYSRFGASSILGGVAGGSLARFLAPHMAPRWLLLLGVGLIVLTAIVVIIAHQRFPLPPLKPEDVTDRGELTSQGGAITIARQPHVALLLCIAMTAALSAIFIEFQFYVSASASGGDSEDMTIFFANVYLILNVVSLFLQLGVTPKLQSWLGLSGSLMVLPMILFGGAATAIVSASAVTRAGLRIAEGGIKSGVHRSVWEQAFLLFPKHIRPSAKVLIDGLGARIAEGLAAAALYVWLTVVLDSRDMSGVSTSWIGVSLIGSTIAWLLLTQLLRRRLRADGRVREDPNWRAPMPDF